MALHLLVTITILFGLIVLSLKQPKLGLITTFIFVALLGDLRRITEYFFRAPQFDPMLMIGPVMAIIFFVMPYKNKLTKTTTLSTLVIIMMALMLIQAFNPLQGDILVGLGGIFFGLIPLVWFWIGRKFADQKFFDNLSYKFIIPVGIAAAILGLYQVFVGFLPFEQNWINRIEWNFISLHAGGTIRPFSFFVSPTEYAIFSIIAASTLILKSNKKPLWLISPIIIAAAFLEASRGIVVISISALAILYAFRKTKNFSMVISKFLISILVLSIFTYFFAYFAKDYSSENRVYHLIKRQTDGILKPTDPESSTLLGHISIVSNGFVTAWEKPFGLGLGKTFSTTRLGGNKISTETDVNIFISCGILGGILAILIVLNTFYTALRYWVKTKNDLAVFFLVILVISFLQWFNGAQYLISYLVWFCIGSLDKINLTAENTNEDTNNHAIGE